MDRNTMIVVCVVMIGFFIFVGFLAHEDSVEKQACYQAEASNPFIKCR
jgi:hypothetical protein